MSFPWHMAMWLLNYTDKEDTNQHLLQDFCVFTKDKNFKIACLWCSGKERVISHIDPLPRLGLKPWGPWESGHSSLLKAGLKPGKTLKSGGRRDYGWVGVVWIEEHVCFYACPLPKIPTWCWRLEREPRDLGYRTHFVLAPHWPCL